MFIVCYKTGIMWWTGGIWFIIHEWVFNITPLYQCGNFLLLLVTPLCQCGNFCCCCCCSASRGKAFVPAPSGFSEAWLPAVWFIAWWSAVLCGSLWQMWLASVCFIVWVSVTCLMHALFLGCLLVLLPLEGFVKWHLAAVMSLLTLIWSGVVLSLSKACRCQSAW